jgi:hypothetical protein
VPYTPPIPSSFTTKGSPVVRPDLALAVGLSSGNPAWTYGAWTQIAAANDLTSHALAYIAIGLSVGAAANWQIQIGTGGAGSEVARDTIHGFGWDVDPLVVERFPLLTIPANARVAARLADSVGNNANAIFIKLGFYPTPL